MPARKRKTERDLDPQKERLYEWEFSWDGWDRSTIPFAQCRREIGRACWAFRLRAPKVTSHTAPEGAVFNTIENRICLGSGSSFNLPTALHETTHYIVYRLFKDRPQDHGPTFLGIYLWLLEQFKVAPRAALRASAHAAGLKWREVKPGWRNRL